MSDDNHTTDLSLVEYGRREDVAALARRVKTMLPGGNRMNDPQARALAQYAIATNANPFRGEVYGFEHRGQFVLVDGYKLLVRWAKRQCPYSEKFDRMPTESLPDGAIGFTCWILRDDARATLKDLVNAGADFQTSYEIASSSAVGVVAEKEMKNDPPKGWDWAQVSRKRALKNALNLSHGAPSPREIAQESWMIGDVETKPEDWTDLSHGANGDEQEQQALINITAREAKERVAEMSPEERTDYQSQMSMALHGDSAEWADL